MARRSSRVVSDRLDFRRFPSLRDFAAAAVPVYKSAISKYGESDDDWAGGSLSEAVRLCGSGDVSSVPAASALADMVNDAVNLAGVRQEWAPDVVGAFASVPAFLAGDPCSMWARSPVQDERGEIDVYFDTGVSWIESREQMQRRGVCVLAVLLELQRVRNVRAHLYTSQRCGNVIVDLSYPFDVSEICAVCACPVITRRLVYAFARDLGDPAVNFARWASKTSGNVDGEISTLRAACGISADSLVLPAARLGEFARLSDRELIQDLNGIIEKVNAAAAL